jgi:hypothetical protein
MNYIRARILHQGNSNEHVIIDSKVGNDQRSKAETHSPMYSKVKSLLASRA